MPRTPEEIKEYHRKWYEDNKDKQAVTMKEWRKNNPDKQAEYDRAWKARHPEDYKNSSWKRGLKHRTGLTVEEYVTMLAKQNGVCAICGEECKTLERLSVDHNHETGVIRELLCRTCNTMIGLAREDARILLNAIQYLEKHA